MTTMYEDRTKPGDLLTESRAMRGRIDEALNKEVQELGRSAILVVILSIAGYLILGILLYFVSLAIFVRTRVFHIQSYSLGNFFLFYTLILVVLMIVGMYYMPKEEYYTGTRSAFFLGNDPFTLKDDVDRGHASLGFLLVIPNFIRENAKNLHSYMTSAKPIKNSTLAAAILILSEPGRRPAEVLETLEPIGFGGGTVKRAADFLQKVEWIEPGKDKDSGASLVRLTEKGNGILKDARNFI